MPPDSYVWDKMTVQSNRYTANKAAFGRASAAWDKSGLETQVNKAVTELQHQAFAKGYNGPIDWIELARGAFEGELVSTLPAYAAARDIAKRALPVWRAMTTPHQKIDDAITKRRSPLPVSRTDDPKFTPGLHAPKALDHSWVVSVMRSSLLDPNKVLWGSTKFDPKDGEVWDQAQLDKLSLEPLDGTIDSLYPGALAASVKH
jgi:hypothetical protein